MYIYVYMYQNGEYVYFKDELWKTNEKRVGRNLIVSV